MEITDAAILDQSYYSRKFRFEFRCESMDKDARVLCLVASIDRDDQLFMESVSGIPENCPSGKIQLRAAEEVGKQIGTKRIVLNDISRFTIFNKYEISSSMLKTLLSVDKPEKMRSYYSDRGYSYLSPSEGIEAVQTVWNLTQRELLEELGDDESAEIVRTVIEKYDLAPEDNIGALFRRLYHSQTGKMQGDCGTLIENLYNEPLSLKYDDLRMAIRKINIMIMMFKDLH